MWCPQTRAKYRCRGPAQLKWHLMQNLVGWDTKHNMSMRCVNIIFAIIGFSSSLLLCVPNVKKWQKKKMAAEKLRIISEALEVAEERVARYQERHDRILSEISAYYLTNTELLEALAGARASMNQALDFAVRLRTIQLNVIRSFPEALDLHLNQNASPRIT